MSIEELDTLLSEMRIDFVDPSLKMAVEALLMSESAPLKEKFLSGTEEASVPADEADAASVISRRAISLMKKAGQDAAAPQNIALSVGLYCYGAVLCTPGYGVEEFVSLFKKAQSNFR